MRTLFAFVLTFALALPASAQPMLYVSNQGEATVHVVDMQTQAVTDTVDLQAMGFSENAKPHHAVAEPDGSFWYLSLIGENTVLKLSPENEIVGRVEFETPGMLAVHPTKDLLLVGRSMSAVNPPKSVGLVTRSDMTIRQADTFFPRPHAITADPQGTYLYTASLTANQILAHNLETEESELIRLGGTTQTLVQFAATPDGKTVLAGGQMTGNVLLMRADGGSLAVTDTLQVGTQPWHPVISPDGRRAYVPNKMSNSISVIDLEAREVVATITGDGLAQPHGSALSPDGKHLFVSNNNMKGDYTPTGSNPKAGTVTVIDTETNEIVKVIEVGTQPTGIGTWGGQLGS